MNKSRLLGIVCIFVSVLLFATTLSAATIIQVASVTSDTSTAVNFDINNIINQNNLSIGYVSGVTDFDAYILSNPTDGNFTSNVAAFNSAQVQIDFDLGGMHLVESLALWNRGWANQGVKDFTLYASNNASFSSSILLGSFTATAVLGTFDATAAEVFSFTKTRSSFIRMDITSIYGTEGVSLNEVAFEAAAVPIPAAAWLFGTGLLGLAGLARRKKAV